MEEFDPETLMSEFDEIEDLLANQMKIDTEVDDVKEEQEQEKEIEEEKTEESKVTKDFNRQAPSSVKSLSGSTGGATGGPFQRKQVTAPSNAGPSSASTVAPPVTTQTAPAKSNPPKRTSKGAAAAKIASVQARRSTYGSREKEIEIEEEQLEIPNSDDEKEDRRDVILEVYGKTDDANGKELQGITFRRLLCRVTSAHSSPSEVTDFLLTYRAYSNPTQLLRLLRLRLSGKVRDATESKDDWPKIRVRVVGLIKSLLTKHWSQMEINEPEGEKTLSLLRSLLADLHSLGLKNPSATLSGKLDRLLKKSESTDTSLSRSSSADYDESTLSDQTARSFSQPPPMPQLSDMALLNTPAPKVEEINVDLLTFHPLELARQLTLIEYNLYSQVKLTECMNQAWTKKNSNEIAPNLTQLIAHFNKVSKWAQTMVLVTVDLRRRVRILTHLIAMAAALSSLNNYNAVMQITASLQSAPIARLKRTWASLPDKASSTLTRLNNLLSPSSSFLALREALRGANPPCIPYIGMFLSDLTFIEEGNENSIKRKRKAIPLSIKEEEEEAAAAAAAAGGAAAGGVEVDRFRRQSVMLVASDDAGDDKNDERSLMKRKNTETIRAVASAQISPGGSLFSRRRSINLSEENSNAEVVSKAKELLVSAKKASGEARAKGEEPVLKLIRDRSVEFSAYLKTYLKLKREKELASASSNDNAPPAGQLQREEEVKKSESDLREATTRLGEACGAGAVSATTELLSLLRYGKSNNSLRLNTTDGNEEKMKQQQQKLDTSAKAAAAKAPARPPVSKSGNQSGSGVKKNSRFKEIEKYTLINFQKFQMMSDVLQLIQRYQQTPYNLHNVPLLEVYFLHLPFIGSEESAYQLSLSLEERETGELNETALDEWQAKAKKELGERALLLERKKWQRGEATMRSVTGQGLKMTKMAMAAGKKSLSDLAKKAREKAKGASSSSSGSSVSEREYESNDALYMATDAADELLNYSDDDSDDGGNNSSGASQRELSAPSSSSFLSEASLLSLYPGCIKSGLLKKKGALRQNWTERFFVLTKLDLSYYKQQGDQEAKGRIILAESTLASHREKGREFSFALHYSNRVYLFQAHSKQEMDSWTSQLQIIIDQARGKMLSPRN